MSFAKEEALALASFGAQTGQAAYVADYRSKLNATTKLRVHLTPENESLFRFMAEEVNLLWKYGDIKKSSTDHSILEAIREVVRIWMHQLFDPRTTALRTLIFGASMKQINECKNNPHVTIHVGGVDSKDVPRTFAKLYERVRRIQKREPQDPTKPLPEPLQTNGLCSSDMLVALQNQYADCKCSFTTSVDSGYDVVYFPDSIYNLDQSDIVRLMTRTGAKMAYGYGLFPMELLFDDIAPSQIYKYREWKDGAITMADVVGGPVSNGYCHRKEAWSTLLRHPILRDVVRASNDYVVEIPRRFGPMMLFTIMPGKKERVTRCLELHSWEKSVLVLSMQDSHHEVLGTFMGREYYNVPERFFVQVKDYIQSLPDEVMSSAAAVPNIVNYCRKTRPGLTISSKQVTQAHFLPGIDLYDFAAVMHLDALLHRKNITGYASNNSFTWCDGFKAMLVNDIKDTWIENFVNYLVQKRFTGKLVLFPPHMEWQSSVAKDSHLLWEVPVAAPAPTKPEQLQPKEGDPKPPGEAVPPSPEGEVADSPLPDDYPVNHCDYGSDSCRICRSIPVDDQRYKHTKGAQEIRIKFSAADARKFANTLLERIQSDGISGTLANIITKFCEKIKADAQDIDKMFRVLYVDGPPGNGKSTYVRSFMKEHPGEVNVFVPLARVADDYSDKECATTHKIFKLVTKPIIVIDEYTLFDYEVLCSYLCCVGANNTMVHTIILVGDHRQCKVREELAHGKYIGDYLVGQGGPLTMEKLDRLSLLVNFRCAANVVDMINAEDPTYKIYARRKDRAKISIMSWDDFRSNRTKLLRKGDLVIAGSNPGWQIYAQEDSDALPTAPNNPKTVQGCTCTNEWLLLLTTTCLHNFDVTRGEEKRCLRIVALSRSKGDLTFVVHGGDMDKFVRHNWNPYLEAKELVQTFAVIPEGYVSKVDPIDPPLVMPSVRPGTDSHMMIADIAPVMTHEYDPETRSLNEKYNEIVPNLKTRPMKIKLAEALEPRTASSAPKSESKRVAMHIGSGLGLRYDNKAGTQLAAVIKRYNKEKKVYSPTEPALRLVDKIVDKFVEVNLNKERVAVVNKLFLGLTNGDTAITSLSARYFSDASRKNYAGRLPPLHEWMTLDEVHGAFSFMRRYANKASFKPLVGAKGLELDKVAQGIISWDVSDCLLFGFACRLAHCMLEWCYVSCSDNDSITDVESDHMKSEEEVRMSYRMACQNVFGAGSATQENTYDVKGCDTIQNIMTLMVTGGIWRRLGFSDTFLELYQTACLDQRVTSKLVNFVTGGENNSGKPGTKLENEAFVDAMVTYVTTVTGPSVKRKCGDDIALTTMMGQCSIDKTKCEEINMYICELDLIYTAGSYGEFCGKIVLDGDILPSLFRKVNRVVEDFSEDGVTFAEKQQAIRDYVDTLVQNDLIDSTVAGTAVFVNREFGLPLDKAAESARQMFEFIQAMGHISFEQWKQIVVSVPDISYIWSDWSESPVDIASIATYKPIVWDKLARTPSDVRPPVRQWSSCSEINNKVVVLDERTARPIGAAVPAPNRPAASTAPHKREWTHMSQGKNGKVYVTMEDPCPYVFTRSSDDSESSN